MFPSLSPEQFSWHAAWPGDNLIFSGGMEATGDASANTDAIQGAEDVDEGRDGLAWESHQNSQHDDDEEKA